MAEGCQIRSLTVEDLPMLLAWRNHPEVRRYMFNQHEISLDEHYNWFTVASQDPTRCLLIVEEFAQAIGYAQFSKVAEGGVADWGFYTRPDAPRGTGRKLGNIALNFAFGGLKLYKVCGQAIASNEASIAFHRHLGFTLEGVLREQQRINGIYQSLYCFGLFSKEWQPKSIDLK